jgi:hypothetical protein
VKVAVTHTTRLTYSADVLEGVTQARMGPHSDSDQHCQQFELRATPSATINQYVDGFGNPTHLVTVAAPHRHMEANEYHIRMAVGRGYRDVGPTRGTFRGHAAEKLSVHVHTQIDP